MQVAAGALHIYEDEVEAQLVIAIWIADVWQKFQVGLYDAASNNSVTLPMPCDVVLPRHVVRNLVN